MKKFLKDAIKDYKAISMRLLYMVSFIITSEFYVFMNTFRGKAYHIESWIDTLIPFNKYFIVAYIFWYVYIGISFTYFIVRNNKKYFKLLLGINVGMIIAFIIYYFFPTTVPRPEVIGNDIFAQTVRWLYRRDNPYNCFPSIHVIDTVLIALYIYKEEVLPNWIKGISTFLAFMIILSTMYVKQHYFYDVIGGIAVAYIVFFIFNYREITAKLKSKAVIAIGEE